MEFQYYIYIVIGVITLVIVCRFFVLKWKKSPIRQANMMARELLKNLQAQQKK